MEVSTLAQQVSERDRLRVVSEMGRRSPAVFGGQQTIDKLGYLADIATVSNWIGGAVEGDRPTGICCLLRLII